MSIVYLGLGSNMGDRADNMCRALDLLRQHMVVERISSFYETEPWGYRDQSMFLNAVCRASTNLSPRGVLALAKEIERRLGREPGFPNAPRPIDIDILMYDGDVIIEPDLSVPHPRLKDRAFVLVPLAEIAPELVHPEEGKTMKHLAAHAMGKGTVHPWASPDPNPCRTDAKVNIRQLTMADYEQAWRLWHLCKVPVGESFERAAVQRMTEHDPDLCLVAELNGAIIGAVIGFLHGGHGRVCNHAVDPRCRGRGIGAMLFKEVEGKLIAKGATEIEAMVPVTSLEGRKFFEDQGYAEDGRYIFMIRQLQQERHHADV